MYDQREQECGYPSAEKTGAEVFQELDRSDELAAQLLERLGLLVERLSPVLLPAPPAPDTARVQAPASLLAQRIAQQGVALHQALEKVNTTIQLLSI